MYFKAAFLKSGFFWESYYFEKKISQIHDQGFAFFGRKINAGLANFLWVNLFKTKIHFGIPFNTF